MNANLPQGEQPVLRIIPMPADTNAHGTIFGGWVMAQVDLAGSVPAYERAQGPIVTVAVNSVLFKEPVFVGDLVSFYARVLKVGRTSITVDVEVFAQRGRDGRTDVVKVTEAQLTYVAIDARRHPRPIPGAVVEERAGNEKTAEERAGNEKTAEARAGNEK